MIFFRFFLSFLISAVVSASELWGNLTDNFDFPDVGQSVGMYERLPLMDRLLLNYDRRVRPGYGTSKPVDNYVNIFVNSFGAISAQTMDYKLGIFLRQRWIDPRLAHDAEEETIAPDASYLSKIWVPDLFFNNEKSSRFHSVWIDNKLLRISRKGEVKYRYQLTYICTLYCNFQYAAIINIGITNGFEGISN